VTTTSTNAVNTKRGQSEHLLHFRQSLFGFDGNSRGIPIALAAYILASISVFSVRFGVSNFAGHGLPGRQVRDKLQGRWWRPLVLLRNLVNYRHSRHVQWLSPIGPSVTQRGIEELCQTQFIPPCD